MAQELRRLFEEERNKAQPNLPSGHEDRFLEKLKTATPQRKKRKLLLVWTKAVAAAVIGLLIVCGGYSAWENASSNDKVTNSIVDIAPSDNEATKTNTSPEDTNGKPALTLADLSPDLKKVETYFITSINVELASLKAGPEDKEMVDAYVAKINELGEEYKELNKELNTIGINDMTITALIENLKLRLQLLQRLKKNLNQSKKDHYEKDTSSSI